MKFKNGVTCLLVAGGLAAASAMAQERQIWEQYYLEGQTDIPPPNQSLSQTSLGVDPEVVLAEENMAMAEQEMLNSDLQQARPSQDEIDQLRDRQAQLDERVDEIEQQQSDVMARLDERQAFQEEEIARSEFSEEPPREQASARGERVVWGEDVPPPVDAAFIRQLQQSLQAQGVSPGPVDGIWGPRTHEALQQYQQQQGLEGSGQLSTQTIASLDLQSGTIQAQQQQQQQQPPEQRAAIEQQQEQLPPQDQAALEPQQPPQDQAALEQQQQQELSQPEDQASLDQQQAMGQPEQFPSQ